jgi:hypothetical protein
VRLSTPLFSVPSMNPSVQKPATSIASQREGGGGVKASQLRGLPSRFPELDEIKVLNKSIIATFTNGKRLVLSTSLTIKQVVDQLSGHIKRIYHHNEVPTQGHARP